MHFQCTAGQWKGGLCGCSNRTDIGGYRTDRQTDQWIAAGDLEGRDHQSKTHKTTRFVLLASVPTSILSLAVKEN
jgi:hypothetical protein